MKERNRIGKNKRSRYVTPGASDQLNPIVDIGWRARTQQEGSSQLKTRHRPRTYTCTGDKKGRNSAWRAKNRPTADDTAPDSGLHSVSNRFPFEMSLVEETWKCDGNPVGTLR